jgi:hypothetical protein
VSELQTGAGDETPLDIREALVRQAMCEIDDLVGNRQALVADDLEERMGKLLVGDLDPKSQVRLGIEREIAQVTAEKDHIAGVELVRRLTEVTSKAWRMKQQRPPESAAGSSALDSAQATTGAQAATGAARARPIPRPTPIPPRKQGLLGRLLGWK